MRRYTIVVNGTEFSLDVKELAADRFAVRVGEKELEVLLSEEVDLPEAEITPAIVAHRGHADEQIVHLVSAPTARPADAARAGNTLSAPMPGTIVSIAVAAGAAVKRGDVLMTLEAMKMVNPIRSPRDGVIAEVPVVQGQTVAHADVLLRFAEQSS